MLNLSTITLDRRLHIPQFFKHNPVLSINSLHLFFADGMIESDLTRVHLLRRRKIRRWFTQRGLRCGLLDLASLIIYGKHQFLAISYREILVKN